MSSPSSKARRLITAFASATVDDSWKGGADPEASPGIELELKLRREALYRYVADLEEQNQLLHAALGSGCPSCGAAKPE